MNPANKAWYWLAAGVLALGLNGYYQDGGMAGLHRLASCAETRMAETRTQFSQVGTVAEATMSGRAHLRCGRSTPTSVVVVRPVIPPQAQARLALLQEGSEDMQAARVQARLARLQQVMARRDLQRAPVEWQKGRISVLDDEGWVQVTLPRVEVDIPQGPVMDGAEPN